MTDIDVYIASSCFGSNWAAVCLNPENYLSMNLTAEQLTLASNLKTKILNS